MNRRYLCITLLSLLTLIGCGSDSNNEDVAISMDNENTDNGNTSGSDDSTKPNVLLIIGDDIGIDAFSGYNLGAEKPDTPNLNKLRSEGILYTNVWSSPTCTPTRAGIITGKYGFRTGVTKVDDPLSTSETSIQKLIKQSSNYNTAVVGKWHLSKDASHPNDMGIDYYAGSLGGGLPDYNSWRLTINGTTNNETAYATSKYTDLAEAWINDQTKPWFLWLAHNAGHTPFHLPPTNLHDRDGLSTDQTSIDANPRPYYFAMIEAMDAEIGRLLNSMNEATRNNTIIIFVGDNGTPGQVVQEYNRRRAKGQIYQGGVHVPMIISGKGVTKVNASDDSLISTVDLFSTIAEITTGKSSSTNDSVSLMSTFTTGHSNPRSFVFTEQRNNEGTFDRAIRNATHKYLSFDDGAEESLFDLEEAPLENPNLLSTNQAPISMLNETQLNALKAEMNSILGK